MSVKLSMKRQCKPRSGIVLGGIGAGGVELRHDGVFYNWNIFNNQPFGTGPLFTWPADQMLFFILRYQEPGQVAKMKLLQIDMGYEVAVIPNHYRTIPWLTGVDQIDYEGTFPFARLKFKDAEMPFDVELEAWSPFIPHDVKNSSLPAVCFNFRIVSRSPKPLDVMLLASMRHAVGYDVDTRYYQSRLLTGENYKGVEFSCGDLEPTHTSYGTQALIALSRETNYWIGWGHRHPYYEYVLRNNTLPDCDVTADRNSTNKETGKKTAGKHCLATLSRSMRMKKGQTLNHSLAMTWHFPNLYSGQKNVTKVVQEGRLEGHWYANHFASADAVAQYVASNIGDLYGRTRKFHDAFYQSDAPAFVLDQINSHLKTFITSAWLTKDFNFGVQEGMTDVRSWGPLATIDVGLYGGTMVASLFPELHQSTLRAHQRLQMANGEIGHGIDRNFTKTDTHEGVKNRLDLPSQYVSMVLRDYLWTGDRAFLEEMWPSVKKALDYVVTHRDANGDGLPDMEGAMCSYDNFPMYGAASFVSSLWLCALKSAIEGAKILGDREAEDKYSTLYERGHKVFEEKLWNGKYYRLYNDEGGIYKGDVDEGCITDQIIGQWQCHQTGLGDLFAPERRRSALTEILRRNFREWGLINCSWPSDPVLKDVPEKCWDDQFNTTWSGTELCFASFLIYEGMWKQALAIIKNVDDRYRKAGMYWDHQEWGGHYFRPMVSWLITNAMLGLTIRNGAYGFAPKMPGQDLTLFFSFAGGYAHYRRRRLKTAEQFEIAVADGQFAPREVTFELKNRRASKVSVALAGKPLDTVQYEAHVSYGTARIRFAKPLAVHAGAALRVTVK